MIKLWPYDLSFTLQHYHFVLVESDMADAYTNSLKVALCTALLGSVIVFLGAYVIEKTRNLGWMRNAMHLMAVLSMAVPGLVLGLGYVLFFNHPANPLNFLYNTMAILVISMVIHYYTSSHLTAVTALQQIDNEFEAVSASLKCRSSRPFCASRCRCACPPSWRSAATSSWFPWPACRPPSSCTRPTPSSRRWPSCTWTRPATSARRRRWPA